MNSKHLVLYQIDLGLISRVSCLSHAVLPGDDKEWRAEPHATTVKSISQYFL